MAFSDYFMKDEALWLPKGSIRAIMALLLVIGVCYLSLTTNDLTVLVGLAGTAIGYYFGSKKESDTTNVDK